MMYRWAFSNVSRYGVICKLSQTCGKDQEEVLLSDAPFHSFA